MTCTWEVLWPQPRSAQPGASRHPGRALCPLMDQEAQVSRVCSHSSWVVCGNSAQLCHLGAGAVEPLGHRLGALLMGVVGKGSWEPPAAGKEVSAIRGTGQEMATVVDRPTSTGPAQCCLHGVDALSAAQLCGFPGARAAHSQPPLGAVFIALSV